MTVSPAVYLGLSLVLVLCVSTVWCSDPNFKLPLHKGLNTAVFLPKRTNRSPQAQQYAEKAPQQQQQPSEGGETAIPGAKGDEDVNQYRSPHIYPSMNTDQVDYPNKPTGDKYVVPPEINEYRAPVKEESNLDCFKEESGYLCCNKDLQKLVKDTYNKMKAEPNFSRCGLQKIVNKLSCTVESKFKVPFEVLVAINDFSQTVHFYKDMACKMQIDNRYIIAYGSPNQDYMASDKCQEVEEYVEPPTTTPSYSEAPEQEVVNQPQESVNPQYPNAANGVAEGDQQHLAKTKRNIKQEH